MTCQEPPITPEQLAALPPDFQALLRAVIDYYERRIAELEGRLNKTPRNSSLSPSSEHPHAQPAPQKQRSGKNPGGQPGHDKYQRALVPVEQCTRVVALIPETCRRCGTALGGSDPQPLRHQVWDIPEIKPLVTEYQRHRLMCPGCSARTCGELPPGVPPSQAGPRLVALLRLMRPIRQEIDGLLLRGAFSGNSKLIGMCRPLHAHRDWLWTFLDVAGGEPTNNVSERALRPAVIWRKLSFGTQSARGSRFVETILTVVETCHRRSRNSFEYLTAAVQAHFAGQPTPSLLAEV